MKKIFVTLAILTGCVLIAFSQQPSFERAQEFRKKVPTGSLDTCMSKNKKKLYVFWENIQLDGKTKLSEYAVTVSIWNESHAPRSYRDEIYVFEPFILIDPKRAGIWPEKTTEEYFVEITYKIKADSVASAKNLDVIPASKTLSYKFKANF